MSYGGIDDVRAGNFIKSQYPGSNFIVLNHKFTASEVKGIISGAHLAVGQSYHFGVFALSSNVPFIGLYSNDYYRLKSEGLLEWYNRGQWGVSIDAIDTISEIAAEILGNWDENVSNLRSVNGQIQKSIDTFYNIQLPRLTRGEPLES
jgi:polysaccharide pyruvyl transferase WcaK-like protein